MYNGNFETPEMQAIRSFISGEQQKINETLRELGDAYARKYSSDFDPEFAPQFNQIFACQNKINRALADLRNLKGLTLCAACNNEYPQNAPACPVCGAPNPSFVPPVQPAPVAPVAPVAQPNLCTGCGAVLVEGNLFCTNCGKRIEEAPAPAAEPVEKVCPNCGAAMPSDSVFCSNCGTRL